MIVFELRLTDMPYGTGDGILALPIYIQVLLCYIISRSLFGEVKHEKNSLIIYRAFRHILGHLGYIR